MIPLIALPTLETTLTLRQESSLPGLIRPKRWVFTFPSYILKQKERGNLCPRKSHLQIGKWLQGVLENFKPLYKTLLSVKMQTM